MVNNSEYSHRSNDFCNMEIKSFHPLEAVSLQGTGSVVCRQVHSEHVKFRFQ